MNTELGINLTWVLCCLWYIRGVIEWG
jgi:hypothetical protein